MREVANVLPDVRLQIALLNGLVSAVREWTGVHADQGSATICYIKYEYLQGVLVFIVCEHVSSKVCLAGSNRFVAYRAGIMYLQRTRHEYK
jgi:hypothetical protein